MLRAAGSCSLLEVVVCGAAHRVCKSEGAPQAPGRSPYTPAGPFPSQGSQPSVARKASANAERTNHGASSVGVWRHHADGVPFVKLCLCVCALFVVTHSSVKHHKSQSLAYCTPPTHSAGSLPNGTVRFNTPWRAVSALGKRRARAHARARRRAACCSTSAVARSRPRRSSACR